MLIDETPGQDIQVINADIQNGYAEMTVEEVDNATFTKEMKDQEAKMNGKKKGGDVAKPSVQAVKQEEVEQMDEADIYSIENKKTGQIYHHSKYPITKNNQKFKQIKSAGGDHVHAEIHVNGKPMKEEVEQMDEISKETAGKYLTAPQGKGANKYKTGEGTSKYPDVETMGKHATNVHRALSRAQSSSLYKKPGYYKEDEQMDERTLTAAETKEKEKNVKGMKKSLSGFKDRYGDKAKSVMYATATKMAKKD